jgi:hypothetical protein
MGVLIRIFNITNSYIQYKRKKLETNEIREWAKNNIKGSNFALSQQFTPTTGARVLEM